MSVNKEFNIPNTNELSGLLIQKVAPKILKFFLDAYSNEGYYKNGTFVGWKDRKRDTGKPILYKSGTMKQSFHLSYISKTEFDIVNTAPYSKYHQNGTEKMVARPFLYDDKKIEEIIAKTAEEELDKIFKNIFK